MADKKISPVWGYFTDESEEKKKCTLCKNVLSSKGGGLFNLTRHLRTKHPIVAAAINQNQQLVITDRSEKNTPAMSPEEPLLQPPTSDPIAAATTATTAVVASTAIVSQPGTIFHPRPKTAVSVRAYLQRPITSKNLEELHRALLEMIAKNYLPFSIVESSSFRQFVNKLNPGYTIPSRKTISNALLEKYYIIKSDEIKEKLKGVKFVALTTDCWTSVAKEAYISLTVHYLDQDTRLQAHMLQCFSFNERHTGENICNELSKSCERWGIKEKVYAVTTDNASNAQSAIALTGWKQVPCFAHTLNLCVQAAIDEIKGTRDRIKLIVELFRRSPLAAERLSAMQHRLGGNKLKVKQDVITRWNSTYDMFQRLIEIKTSVISTLANDYPRVQNLETEDVEIMAKACQVLEPFKTVTEIMSSEKKVTVSEIITLSHLLLKHIIKMVDTPSLPLPVHSLAQKLKDQLQTRFLRIDENSLFAVSTILDPRLKKYGFPENRPASYQKARDCLYDLAARVVLPSSSSQITTEASTSSASASASDPSVNIWAEFDSRVSGCLARITNPRAASIVEVDKYLEEPLLERQRDPFRWWDEKKHIYPRLYQLVLKRFCVPASSVSSERVFSKAGQMISDRRSRLLGLKVDKLLFLNFNM